jgi:hypothetical protein
MALVAWSSGIASTCGVMGREIVSLRVCKKGKKHRFLRKKVNFLPKIRKNRRKYLM